MHDPSHDESGRHGPALKPRSLLVVGRLIVAWPRIAIGGDLRGLVIGALRGYPYQRIYSLWQGV